MEKMNLFEMQAVVNLYYALGGGVLRSAQEDDARV